MKKTAQNIQADYYRETANAYDTFHIHEADKEHDLALYFLSSFIKFFSIKSVLDVGAGTGRTIEFITKEHPDIKIIGIEPIKELREQAYGKGISESILIEGDGNRINFKNGEFDLVCEFGVLHHVSRPQTIVSEMLRVANKCIYISDCNNFGQGTLLSRSIKQGVNFFGLWQLYNLIKTRGKKYQISKGDGVFYSYSVFNNYKQIKRQSRTIHIFNTKNGKTNLYRTASHIGLLAIK